MNMFEVLPLEIIVEIITRLSLKSKLNCSCVCKLWRTLISPNLFLTKPDTTLFFLYHPISLSYSIFEHDPRDNNNRRSTDDQVVPMKPSFPRTNSSEGALSSCNGLICYKELTRSSNIHIYNPFIGQKIEVHTKYTRYGFAFGFCPITNKYKLLRMARKEWYIGRPEFEVYTLGSNSDWRYVASVRNVPADKFYNIPPEPAPICGGGVMYWLFVSEGTQFISSFHLAGERLELVDIPPIGGDRVVSRLGFLAQCLVATATKKGSSEKYMEIWVRKESMWSKNWVVCDDHDDIVQWRFAKLVPTKLLPDGRILIMNNGALYCYDPEGRRFKFVNFPCIWSRVIHYSPTLVSPKDLMELGGSL